MHFVVAEIKGSRDPEIISALNHSSRHYCSHAQLAPDHMRVNLIAFVTKDRATRHHFQIRQLRSAVDDTFGDAV